MTDQRAIEQTAELTTEQRLMIKQPAARLQREFDGTFTEIREDLRTRVENLVTSLERPTE